MKFDFDEQTIKSWADQDAPFIEQVAKMLLQQTKHDSRASD